MLTRAKIIPYCASHTLAHKQEYTPPPPHLPQQPKNTQKLSSLSPGLSPFASDELSDYNWNLTYAN